MGADQKNSDVFWLTPVHGVQPPSAFWRVMMALKKKHNINDLMLQGKPDINAARSQLANLALGAGAEILFWVDGDNIPTIEAFEMLVEACREMGGVHAAPYLKPMTSVVIPGAPSPMGFAFGPEQGQTIGIGEAAGDPIPVLYTGFGCTAIHRSVFDKMSQVVPDIKWRTNDTRIDGPHFFNPVIAKDFYMSDDVVFGYRARQLGVPVMVHGAVPVMHVKTQPLAAPGGVFELGPDGIVLGQR